jgi:hypothetical protein
MGSHVKEKLGRPKHARKTPAPVSMGLTMGLARAVAVPSWLPGICSLGISGSWSKQGRLFTRETNRSKVLPAQQLLLMKNRKKTFSNCPSSRAPFPRVRVEVESSVIGKAFEN